MGRLIDIDRVIVWVLSGLKKGLNCIKRGILKGKVILFWIVVGVVAFTLVVYLWWGYGRPCDYQLWISGTWALLSLGIGAMIFFQLEDYKEVENHEDLIKLVTDKIKGSQENDIVVITPNLNLGQTTMPLKFNEYKGAVLKKKAGKIYFYLICKDDFPYKYHKFDLNASDKNKSIYFDNGPCPCPLPDHLSYVKSLFDSKSFTKKEITSLCEDYNNFVDVLRDKKDSVFVEPIKYPFNKSNSEEMDKGIFMIYDGTQLLAYKVSENGLCVNVVETDHKEICNCLLEVHNQKTF